MKTAASVKSLMQIKDVDREIAEKVRKVWKSARGFVQRNEAKLEIDGLIGTYGVEVLGAHKRTGLWVEYCNGGDTYTTTISFVGSRLVVGCWGDYVEKVRPLKLEDV